MARSKMIKTADNQYVIIPDYYNDDDDDQFDEIAEEYYEKKEYEEKYKDYCNLISEISEKFDSLGIEESLYLYSKLCDCCRMIHGDVDSDYDECPTKRGKEGIDIHHIDETIEDNIGVKTQKAIESNNKDELQRLKKYNKKERLVYADKEQHFILHILIEKIKDEDIKNKNGNGINYIYPYLAKDFWSKQQQQYEYHDLCQELYIKTIYNQICKIYKITNNSFGIMDIFHSVFRIIDDTWCKVFNTKDLSNFDNNIMLEYLIILLDVEDKIKTKFKIS